MQRSNAVFDLPDYSSIIDSPYEHAALKRIVLQDLQSVVQAKLVLIDSLLAEKETDVVLLNRLNEFHRDLGYQLKSNLDLAAAGAQGAASPSEPGNYADAGFLTFADVGREAGITDKGQRNPLSPLDQNPILPGETEVQLGIDPFDDVINRLKDKRRQYQALLQRLQAELLY